MKRHVIVGLIILLVAFTAACSKGEAYYPLDGKAGAQAKITAQAAEISGIDIDNSGNTTGISFDVKNTGEYLQELHLTFSFYDADKKQLGENPLVLVTGLEKGKSMNFRAGIADDYSRAKYYKLRIDKAVR